MKPAQMEGQGLVEYALIMMLVALIVQQRGPIAVTLRKPQKPVENPPAFEYNSISQ
jgi:hypothetical protein